ncbi:MAG: YdeI/OmpD-associated family protein, partial [Nanoarchaeota archaeon]
MNKKEIASGVVHVVPTDLQKALISDKVALAVWESLTPLAHNEWICWVESVKKSEKRREHVERV